MDSGVRPGFEFQLYQLLAEWTWESPQPFDRNGWVMVIKKIMEMMDKNMCLALSRCLVKGEFLFSLHLCGHW